VWNVQTGAVQAVLTGHQDRIDRVAFSPDSLRLATAGEESDSTVRLWDAQTGAAILADQDHQAGLYAMRPRSFAFSPDGALFAATSQFIPVAGSPQVGTEGILLWDAQTGQVQATVPQPVGDERTQLLFSPDGRLLVYTMDGDSPAHVAGVVNVYGLISGATPRAGLTLSGSPPLAFKAAVPQTWLAADPIPPRYQVDFKNDYETFLTCPYTGNNQVIYEVEVVTVTVTDLKTSQQVAQQTFRGSDSAQCNSVEDFPVGGGKSKYVTSDATADQFTQWFTSTMTPLMP
jgi:Tol biopolymer transport system component